jgi:RNA polymerase sigma factor (sigma-70 family)
MASFAGKPSRRSTRRQPRRSCRTIASSARDDAKALRSRRGEPTAPTRPPPEVAAAIYDGLSGTAGMPQRAAVRCRCGASNGTMAISAEQLLHRVSAGNADAVQECIARFGGLVWALARRSGLPESELEDAVHDIFTELWHNGHKYDPNIASEAAFVAIIARRRLIDRRRRISRRPASSELTEFNGGAAAGPTPGSRPEVAEEAATAARALESLSAEQQRVLRLSVYEGLSHELISRATGLPLGTVKTHARRGLMRLREMLGGPKNSPPSQEAAS